MPPIALAYPRDDVKVEQGRYGPMLPRTPANGWMLICRTKPGAADALRAGGIAIERIIRQNPSAFASLSWHYARWILFDDDTRFIFMTVFDTDFDKYLEDTLAFFRKAA